jgi:hypothetical protein
MHHLSYGIFFRSQKSYFRFMWIATYDILIMCPTIIREKQVEYMHVGVHVYLCRREQNTFIKRLQTSQSTKLYHRAFMCNLFVLLVTCIHARVPKTISCNGLSFDIINRPACLRQLGVRSPSLFNKIVIITKL